MFGKKVKYNSNFIRSFSGALLLALWVGFLLVNSFADRNSAQSIKGAENINGRISLGATNYHLHQFTNNSDYSSLNLNELDNAVEDEDDTADSDFIVVNIISFLINKVDSEKSPLAPIDISCKNCKTVSLFILHHSWKSFLA